MFIGNDVLAPYNYNLLAYDLNINKRIVNTVEDDNGNKGLNDLKEVYTLAISDEKSGTTTSTNNDKTHEELYKENELNNRKKYLREHVLKKLTCIKINIDTRELDEYSHVKKLYLKKIEKDKLQEQYEEGNIPKKKKKKRKTSSILNSIINYETRTDDGDAEQYLNYMDTNIPINNMNEQDILNDNKKKDGINNNSIVPFINKPDNNILPGPIIKKSDNNILSSDALKNIKTLDIYKKIRKPTWHYPYKLYRVIVGHSGWVNCVDVDVSNEWFATGSNDRLIKIWDLATCKLKLTLTGHINSVKDIKISKKNPYLFSCGEDNRVKCWDLEYNKVIRDYHGHLSGVYCLSLHPSLDILMSGGRDAVVRVWDIRTKNSIFVLSGHTGTIMSLNSQSVEPQVISGSQDKMIRLWDLNNGKCRIALTHHKKKY
uniref:Pre-mRNA-splicing factor PRP46 n=1 Tax=Piliocolobus tephrosceles TaxID=591936 RepID=A0A8C9H9U5_9PRIM